jgi:hypothetical protein
MLMWTKLTGGCLFPPGNYRGLQVRRCLECRLRVCGRGSARAPFSSRHVLYSLFRELYIMPSPAAGVQVTFPVAFDANDKSYSHTRQDITKVNFANIAWTATMVSLCVRCQTALLMGSCDQVRFVLSDSRFEYSPKSPLTFHYQKFYNNLMPLFEDRKQSVDASSLLDWWNRYGGFTRVRLLN